MRRRSILSTLLALTMVAPLAAGSPAHAAVTSGTVVRLDRLAPVAIVDVTGTHHGDVSALAVKDQSATSVDPSKVVRFGGPGVAYEGYTTFTVPPAVSPPSISTIALDANFHGPTAAERRWTFAIYDFATNAWVRLGDQDHCGGDAGTRQWPCDDLHRRPWKEIRYNAIHPDGGATGDFVDPGTREIRIRLRAAEPRAAALDLERVEVYSEQGSPTIWTPAVKTRWQWQLQAAPGMHPATHGIDVGICERPFTGGRCVRPRVFDIDLYVDPSIAGRYGWKVNAAAVRAIHASDRRAIGYVTAGDIERWRPDYQQFVDFDERCDGCLRGNPFSKVFPDEYWASLNDGKGQRTFMLQMLRARTDRVAAAGFDGIEYDIVDAYAQGRRVTGFRISAQSQLTYNLALAAMAHEDGLSVALKNDGGQIPDLLSSFDYAINEQCFQYDECAGGGYPKPAWRAFVLAGKPVFEAEYRIDASTFCPKANRWDFNSILKSRDYSLYARPWTPCR
jgi:endo-alpha-1,4-polygalactosaminidase (GH114 family)